MRWTLFAFVIGTSSAHAEEVFSLNPDDFAGAEIIILGEKHDEAEHHLTQAALVALLSPKAVVFEMLTAEQAGRVTSATADSPDLAEILEWDESGWPDFALYAPIFASRHGAIVVGAAPDDETTAIARDEGAAAAIPDTAFGLSDALPDPENTTRERDMQDAHCGALPAETLPWFVDQQRFADAAFSQATLAALKAHGAPVVVIAGNGHARNDWGMPVYLNRVAPDVAVVTLGQITFPQDAPPYDLWIQTEVTSTDEDPCAAFQ